MGMGVEDAERTVLPKRLGGGPHGLGDPDDHTLRKVEMEVLIPKKMREKAHAEKCVKEVEEFGRCCKDASIAMVVKCRKENSALKACLTQWYNDEGFKNMCKQEYLQERSEFRRTGIGKKSARSGH